MLQRGIPWRMVPTGFPGIDPAFNTVFAITAHSYGGYDHASGKPLLAYSTGAPHTASACPYGSSLYNGSTVYPRYLLDVKPFGSDDFAVGVVGTFESTTAVGIALSNYVNLTSGPQWRMQPNVHNLAVAAGAFSFTTYDGGTFSAVSATSLVTTDAPVSFLGVRRGTTLELWKNGILVASTTATIRNVTNTSTAGGIGFGWGEYIYASTKHRALGYGIKQTITPAMAAVLSANPFMIFAP